MRRIRRFLSEGAIPKSTIALLVALLASRAGSAQGTTSAFTPGTREIFAMDLGSAGKGGLPNRISVDDRQRDAVAIVTKDAPMLRASKLVDLIVSLPEVLPDAFTLEFEIIPKQRCAPEDISFEGTRAVSRSESSMHVVWTTETLIAIGGGEYKQIPMPQELKEVVGGQPTTIQASFDGGHFKLFTNGQQLFDLDKRRFVRGRVLRVTLGGQDDGKYAVHLSKLRIAASSGTAVGSTSSASSGSSGSSGSIQSAGTGTIASTAPTAATLSTAPPANKTPTGTATTNPTTPGPSVFLAYPFPSNQGWGVALGWTPVSGITTYWVSRKITNTTDPARYTDVLLVPRQDTIVMAVDHSFNPTRLIPTGLSVIRAKALKHSQARSRRSAFRPHLRHRRSQ